MSEQQGQGGIPMSDMLQCLRCGGAMDEGYIPDRGHYGMLAPPSAWVEGEPEQSFWTGLTTDGKQQYKVVTFRCQTCGHLEWFANEAVYE